MTITEMYTILKELNPLQIILLLSIGCWFAYIAVSKILLTEVDRILREEAPEEVKAIAQDLKAAESLAPKHLISVYRFLVAVDFSYRSANHEN